MKLVSIFRMKEIKKRPGQNQPVSANWCVQRFALMTPCYINGVVGGRSYISSTICAQADFDFVKCSLLFSVPPRKSPSNDERSLSAQRIGYNTCETLVMTVCDSLDYRKSSIKPPGGLIFFKHF